MVRLFWIAPLVVIAFGIWLVSLLPDLVLGWVGAFALVALLIALVGFACMILLAYAAALGMPPRRRKAP